MPFPYHVRWLLWVPLVWWEGVVCHLLEVISLNQHSIHMLLLGCHLLLSDVSCSHGNSAAEAMDMLKEVLIVWHEETTAFWPPYLDTPIPPYHHVIIDCRRVYWRNAGYSSTISACFPERSWCWRNEVNCAMCKLRQFLWFPILEGFQCAEIVV